MQRNNESPFDKKMMQCVISPDSANRDFQYIYLSKRNIRLQSDEPE